MNLGAILRWAGVILGGLILFAVLIAYWITAQGKRAGRPR
jgi:hypothetical protein